MCRNRCAQHGSRVRQSWLSSLGDRDDLSGGVRTILPPSTTPILFRSLISFSLSSLCLPFAPFPKSYTVHLLTDYCSIYTLGQRNLDAVILCYSQIRLRYSEDSRTNQFPGSRFEDCRFFVKYLSIKCPNIRLRF